MKETKRLVVGVFDNEALSSDAPINCKLENYSSEELLDLCNSGNLKAKLKGKLYDITALALDGTFTMKLVS
jgi:hypothetical protein